MGIITLIVSVMFFAELQLHGIVTLLSFYVILYGFGLYFGAFSISWAKFTDRERNRFRKNIRHWCEKNADTLVSEETFEVALACREYSGVVLTAITNSNILLNMPKFSEGVVAVDIRSLEFGDEEQLIKGQMRYSFLDGPFVVSAADGATQAAQFKQFHDDLFALCVHEVSPKTIEEVSRKTKENASVVPHDNPDPFPPLE